MEKALYTHRQMSEMMIITRSWTLNNPAGPLPYLPIDTECAQNDKELIDTLPPSKKSHWLLKLFFKYT